MKVLHWVKTMSERRESKKAQLKADDSDELKVKRDRQGDPTPFKLQRKRNIQAAALRISDGLNYTARTELIKESCPLAALLHGRSISQVVNSWNGSSFNTSDQGLAAYSL